MIEEAESKSFHICEICGGYGKRLLTDGFRTTRCNEHKSLDLAD